MDTHSQIVKIAQQNGYTQTQNNPHYMDVQTNNKHVESKGTQTIIFLSVVFLLRTHTQTLTYNINSQIIKKRNRIDTELMLLSSNI